MESLGVFETTRTCVRRGFRSPTWDDGLRERHVPRVVGEPGLLRIVENDVVPFGRVLFVRLGLLALLLPGLPPVSDRSRRDDW